MSRMRQHYHEWNRHHHLQTHFHHRQDDDQIGGLDASLDVPLLPQQEQYLTLTRLRLM